MKIGIFGGSFDPFTIAHRAIVEKVLEKRLVDFVVILPTIVDYYRKDKEKWLTDNQKTMCITRMIEDSKYFRQISLCTAEFYLKNILSQEQIDQRRSVHMVDEVKRLYGSDNEYYYIIGTDSLKNLKTWYKWQELLEKVNLIAVDGRDGEYVKTDIKCQFINIDDRYSKVSASEIRKRYSELQDYLNDLGYCSRLAA